jgi:hypothetical protein
LQLYSGSSHTLFAASHWHGLPALMAAARHYFACHVTDKRRDEAESRCSSGGWIALSLSFGKMINIGTIITTHVSISQGALPKTTSEPSWDIRDTRSALKIAQEIADRYRGDCHAWPAGQNHVRVPGWAKCDPKSAPGTLAVQERIESESALGPLAGVVMAAGRTLLRGFFMPGTAEAMGLQERGRQAAGPRARWVCEQLIDSAPRSAHAGSNGKPLRDDAPGSLRVQLPIDAHDRADPANLDPEQMKRLHQATKEFRLVARSR